MFKNIKIENYIIGDGKPVFIIAEAGVNHNGCLDLALKLIETAKKAGADAVKFQTFKAGQVVTCIGKMADYQKKNIGKTKNQLEMLEGLELEEGFYKHIIEHCRQKKIIFLSTPHGGFESVDFLQSLGVPAFKFGSGDLTNLPVLQHTAKFKKPIILGTGMANMREVKEAVDCIKKAGNEKIIVLHCTTNYPCPLGRVNLRAMQTMMRELKVLVGYSDHTLGTQVPIMATTLGACVVEKHFTLDKKLPGPDHKASVGPGELREMVKEIRNVEVILGLGTKKPTGNEISMIKNIRKSIVSLCDIKKGEKLTKKNIGIKRPGIGILPKEYSNLLSRKARKDIKFDSTIKKSDYV